MCNAADIFQLLFACLRPTRSFCHGVKDKSMCCALMNDEMFVINPGICWCFLETERLVFELDFEALQY